MNNSVATSIPSGQQFVFLVEDDDDLRSDLVHALQVSGYTTFAFANPEQFLSEFEPLVPAVLVTDMRMPKKSGVQLQADLLEKGHQLPIIFISGASSDEQIVKAFKNGAFDFLLKPFGRDAPRERQVFSLMAKGYDNKLLVNELGLALPTVKQYKSEVMEKLCLSSLTELIALSASIDVK